MVSKKSKESKKSNDVINRLTYNAIRNELNIIEIPSFIDFVKLLINYCIFDKKYLSKIIKLYSYKNCSTHTINIIHVYNFIADMNVLNIMPMKDIYDILKRTNYKCCNRNNKILYSDNKIYSNYSGMVNIFSHIRAKKIMNNDACIQNISEIYKFCIYEYYNYKNNNRLYNMNIHMKSLRKKIDLLNNESLNNLLTSLSNENYSDILHSSSSNSINIGSIENIEIDLIEDTDINESYDYLADFSNLFD